MDEVVVVVELRIRGLGFEAAILGQKSFGAGSALVSIQPCPVSQTAFDAIIRELEGSERTPSTESTSQYGFESCKEILLNCSSGIRLICEDSSTSSSLPK